MKPSDLEKFDVKKFHELFYDEPNLPTDQKLVKYGYISGYIQGLFSDERINALFKETKNFQDALEKTITEDWKKFQSDVLNKKDEKVSK